MSMTLRFYVAEVSQFASSTGYADPAPGGKVVLRPALREEANAAWASATPAGVIELTVRGAALPWYQERIGKTLHIIMDDVPEEPAGE